MRKRPRTDGADLPEKAVVSREYLGNLQAALDAGGARDAAEEDAVFSALISAVSNAIIQLDAMVVGLKERVDRLEGRTKGQ
jgi:hypothetical protein